jgi:hypothetical protein
MIVASELWAGSDLVEAVKVPSEAESVDELGWICVVLDDASVAAEGVMECVEPETDLVNCDEGFPSSEVDGHAEVATDTPAEESVKELVAVVGAVSDADGELVLCTASVESWRSVCAVFKLV